MNDSRIAQQWEDRGFEMGFKKGILMGQILAFQEMLKQPLTPVKELRARSEQELDSLLTQLCNQLLSKGN